MNYICPKYFTILSRRDHVWDYTVVTEELRREKQWTTSLTIYSFGKSLGVTGELAAYTLPQDTKGCHNSL